MLYAFSFLAIFSGILLSAMLGFRLWEVQKGRVAEKKETTPLFSINRSRIEEVSGHLWDKSVNFLRKIIIRAFAILAWAVRSTVNFLLRLPITKRIQRLITGENEYEKGKRNGASLYLKNITTHKDATRERAQPTKAKKGK